MAAAMTATADELHDEDVEAWRAEVVPRLFADRDCIGYAQRVWAWEQWVETYGHFDSIRISHAWIPSMITRPRDEPPDHCQAASLHASLYCGHHRWEDETPCQCVGGTLHRGMCLYCDWEGPDRVSERKAIEDAHDHAWPGWRDLPVVPRWPEEGSGKKKGMARAAWWAKVHELYPPGWVEQGGPILTRRQTGSTGAHQGWSHPHGGWDLCGEMDEHSCGLSRGKTKCPGLAGCISDWRKCQPWPYPDDDDEDE
jgi:hypothetical protein